MRPSGAFGLGLEGWVQFSADACGVRCLRERDLLEKMRRARGKLRASGKREGCSWPQRQWLEVGTNGKAEGLP